jgi:hypothetical protein
MSDRSTTLSLSPPPLPKPPGPPANHFRVIRTLASTPLSSSTLCLPRNILASDDDLSASLVVVRMNTDPTILRNEFEPLDARGEVLSSQFSGFASTSWFCTRPVGGPTLSEFGGKMHGIPGWMIAHILLGVVSQVVDGEEVKVDDVVLDIRPQGEGVYVYRDYPIVRVDARDAGNEDATARSVLELMRDAIVEWSDVASYIASARLVGQEVLMTNEPVLLVLRDVMALLETDIVGIENVVDEFEARLVDIRHEGPMEMPEMMVQKLHMDLMTEEEVKWAFREPAVFRFTWHIEEFRAIVTNEKVHLGKGGCAGMKTKRILVARFGSKKDAFLGIMGESEYADTEAVTDDKLTMPEGESEDGQFDWDDEMMMD